MEFCKVWQRRYIFFVGTLGLAMPIFNTPTMVLLQEKVIIGICS